MLDVDRSGDTVSQGASFNPGAIAVGLLRNDLSLLPLLFVLLSVSAVLDAILQSASGLWSVSIMALDRAMQIAVASTVVLRWRWRLQTLQGPKVRAVPVVARISLISVAASIVFMTPFFGIAASPNPVTALAFIALLIFGCVWCLRVYFFFAVTGLLGLPLGASFARAIQMAKQDSGAVMRSLISPVALAAVASALCLMPYPDGRSLPWMAASSACEGIFWILSSYTGLGLALSMLSESEWRLSGLSHYRLDRLRTLEAQGGKTLPKYLAPRFGFIMLAVGLFLFAGNLVRLGQLPPAASVMIKSVAVADYKITVALDLEDRQYDYRGLQPQAFFIASKTGTLQSTHLTSASLDPDKEERLTAITPGTGGAPVALYLTFSSTKTAEVLRTLDNMWLWYRAQPLRPITPQMLLGQGLVESGV